MVRTMRPILIVGLAVSIAVLGGCTDANLKRARRHQKEKNYDQAIHFYKLALEKEPENRSARYSLVEVYAAQFTGRPEKEVTPEMIEEAMKELRPIAEPLMTDPNVKRYISLIYQMLAKNYAETGLDEKAAEAWGVVAEIEPSFAEAHFNYGVALTKLGRFEESLTHFEKTIALNPYFIQGYFAIGNSFLRLDRNEEAIKYYLKALELNPDDPGVRHNLGVAYSKTEDYERAIKEFEKTLEIEPAYGAAYLSLAGAYTNLGETQKAQEAEKKWREYNEAVLQSMKEAEEKPVAPGDSR